jgi:hypothetical protein
MLSVRPTANEWGIKSNQQQHCQHYDTSGENRIPFGLWWKPLLLLLLTGLLSSTSNGGTLHYYIPTSLSLQTRVHTYICVCVCTYVCMYCHRWIRFEAW